MELTTDSSAIQQRAKKGVDEPYRRALSDKEEVYKRREMNFSWGCVRQNM